MGSCLSGDGKKEPANIDKGKAANETKLKFLLTGNPDAGKTSLILKYINKPDPSVFKDGIYIHKLEDNGVKYDIEFLDTQGQEKFRTITSFSYDRTNAIMIVYDVTDKQSFDDIHQWVTEGERYAPTASFLLVGNKVDKVNGDEGRAVPKKDAQDMAENKGMTYLETSALSGAGVQEAFKRLITETRLGDADGDMDAGDDVGDDGGDGGEDDD